MYTSRVGIPCVILAALFLLISCGSKNHRGREEAIQPLHANSGQATTAITIGVIGDMPYTKSQRRSFGTLMNKLSADTEIQFVIHLGDILGGNTPCDTTYMEWMRDVFNTYAQALMYTPGDNEWADCRNKINPLYPLERLDTLRNIFFLQPGKTLGKNPRLVATQCVQAKHRAPCLPENQMWTEPGIVFGLVHVPGSHNGLEPWSTDAHATAQQRKNFDERLAATLAWMQDIFAHARERQARIIVIGTHADLWGTRPGYGEIVQTLAHLALEFRQPVLLLSGDTHHFRAHRPLTRGSRFYGIDFPVPNVLQIIVQGGAWHPLEYMRTTIDPHNSETPFSATRVTPDAPHAEQQVVLPR